MAQNDYTCIFIIWAFISQLHRTSVTQAFWQELLCVIRGLHKVLSVSAPITHSNCPGTNFPIARTCVTQKNSFRIICVIISGIIVRFDIPILWLSKGWIPRVFKTNLAKSEYPWGQNDYIPNSYSRRIIFGNYVLSNSREILGEVVLNYLTKITLPKLFANYSGNVFVPCANSTCI